MNILIVDDNQLIAQVVEKTFRKVPVVNIIDKAFTYNDAITKAASDMYNVIITDIDLQDTHNGLDLCKKVRSENSEVILVVVTAFHSQEFIKTAFSLGVNDYITKPFQRDEMQMRVMRWWEYLKNQAQKKENIGYHDLEYVFKTNTFFFKKKKLKLAKRSKQLLLFFLERQEQIISHREIQNHLWGDFDKSLRKRNVPARIAFLKKSLAAYCPEWIQSIRGEGYVLQKSLRF